MNETLPCSTCTAKCCGPVPLAKERMKIIGDYLDTLPQERIDQLRNQYRSPLTCSFVDMSNYTCAIYPVRPEICKAFGRIEKLICPVVGHVVNPLLPILADVAMTTDQKSGLVGYSSGFSYIKGKR